MGAMGAIRSVRARGAIAAGMAIVVEVLADGGQSLAGAGAPLGAGKKRGDRPQHRVGGHGERAVDAQMDRHAQSMGEGGFARRRPDRQDGAPVVGQRQRAQPAAGETAQPPEELGMSSLLGEFAGARDPGVGGRRRHGRQAGEQPSRGRGLGELRLQRPDGERPGGLKGPSAAAEQLELLGPVRCLERVKRATEPPLPRCGSRSHALSWQIHLREGDVTRRTGHARGRLQLTGGAHSNTAPAGLCGCRDAGSPGEWQLLYHGRRHGRPCSTGRLCVPSGTPVSRPRGSRHKSASNPGSWPGAPTQHSRNYVEEAQRRQGRWPPPSTPPERYGSAPSPWMPGRRCAPASPTTGPPPRTSTS
jgi:hypothetical protein